MTREEAINEIKSWDFLEGKEIEAIHTLIPELRESEDERIRKELKEAFEAYDIESKWNGIPIRSIFAWLEKQKEQPTNEEMLRTLRVEYEKGVADTIAKYEQKEQKEIPLMNGDTDLYFDEWNQQHSNPTKRECFEEGMKYVQRLQKEQKPNVEICPHSIKSKSYKENGYPIEDCDYGLEIAFDILEKTFGEVRGYQTDDGIREHQTAIEAVRKAKEQKHAEWSERDKAWLSEVYDAINHSIYSEDEKQAMKKYIDSLRSSWKPSEAQLMALHSVIDDESDTIGNEQLKLLYNDLKKLGVKEEPEYYQHFDPDC